MSRYCIGEQTGRWQTLNLVIAIVIALFLLVGINGYAMAAEPGPVVFERPAPHEVPEKVAEWVESMKEKQGLHKLDYENKTWVMTAWGSQPTGGYTILAEEAELTQSGVIVLTVKLTAPGSDDVVTQVITYPYDLIAIDQTDAALAAEFGQPPTLWLPPQGEGLPMVSERVFLQEPVTGSKLGQTLRVKGAAQLFEGTFHVVLEDGHFQLINQMETASAGGPEWGMIDIELDVPMPSSPDGYLIIMWQDARDGSWVEEIGVPVRFEDFVPIGSDPTPPNLSDIGGHWAEEAINRAVNVGFVNGYPDGTFKPESKVTRAEFLKMVLTAFGIEPAAADGPSFGDTAGHWAKGYVDAATRIGVIKADDYGSNLEPDRNITRLEMAIQLVRILDLEHNRAQYADEAANFNDTANLDVEELGYLGTSVALGIFEGYPDNTVGPERESTRAEAVTVIHRALLQKD